MSIAVNNRISHACLIEQGRSGPFWPVVLRGIVLRCFAE
jgi:hypothetical protein